MTNSDPNVAQIKKTYIPFWDTLLTKIFDNDTRCGFFSTAVWQQILRVFLSVIHDETRKFSCFQKYQVHYQDPTHSMTL